MLKINRERLLQNISAQGKIGWIEGRGLQRRSYTPAYTEARNWLRIKMEEAGLKTRIDGVGNLFGRIEGKISDTIISGSHLDSVDNGGIYDGPLGIMAALEALTSIKENGYVPQHSMEVVAFIGEEGEPLGGTFGSRAFAGLLPEGYKKELLEDFGVTGNDVDGSKCNPKDYTAFLELHIEQGPFLERKEISIGIPSGIVGVARYEIIIHGTANHAGTTPMGERKDAMRSAADLIHNWYKWIDTRQDLVCNVGTMAVKPGHVSVVPEEVRFILEIRSIDDASIDTAYCEFARMSVDVSPCTVVLEPLGRKSAVALNKDIINTIRRVSDEIGLDAAIMPSGASHDSSPIANIMPVGMIFVPSHDGVSHSKDEFTSSKDIINGSELLLQTLVELDSYK